MASLSDYVTLEDLADYMDADTLPENMATLSLSAAQQMVRQYTGQDITYYESVEVHDGKNRNTLRLRQRPVWEVMEVLIDDVATTDFYLDGAIVKLTEGTFEFGIGNISVEYAHGWVPLVEVASDGIDPVPADIVLVTLSVAARNLRGLDDDQTLQSETIGQYSYTRDTKTPQSDLLTAESAVLDRYTVHLTP